MEEDAHICLVCDALELGEEYLMNGKCSNGHTYEDSEKIKKELSDASAI